MLMAPLRQRPSFEARVDRAATLARASRRIRDQRNERVANESNPLTRRTCQGNDGREAGGAPASLM